jgi:hypothetical protein
MTSNRRPLTRYQARRQAAARAARRVQLASKVASAACVLPLVGFVVGLVLLMLVGGATAPLINAGSLPLATMAGVVGALTIIISLPVAWAIGESF